MSGLVAVKNCINISCGRYNPECSSWYGADFRGTGLKILYESDINGIPCYVRPRERNLGGPYFYRLGPEVDYHFVTECLFTQLLERRVRMVKHSSNAWALMQAASPDVREATRRMSVRCLAMLTRSSRRAVGTEWNSTSINFFLHATWYFSNNTRHDRLQPRGLLESMVRRDPERRTRLMSQ